MFTPDTGQPFIVWHCPGTSCREPVSQSQSTYSEPVYLKQHCLDFLPICIAASGHDSVIYMGIWTVRRRHEAHGTLKIRCVIVAMRIACAARGTWQLSHLQRLSFAEQEGQDDIFRIYVWKGHPSERVKCNRRLACFIVAGYYYYFPLDLLTSIVHSGQIVFVCAWTVQLFSRLANSFGKKNANVSLLLQNKQWMT